MDTQSFKLLATYNQWQNQSLYQACESLTDAQLCEDRGAFFGSLLATLNHILVGDLFWLKRFSQHSSGCLSPEDLHPFKQPNSLNHLLYNQFAKLKEARLRLDSIIIDFCHRLTDQDLSSELHYKNSAGQDLHKNFAHLILHLFNHQTHHRGQVSVLLSQLGIDYGATDLVYKF